MANALEAAQRIDQCNGRSLVRLLCEAEPVVLDEEQWVQVMPFGPFVEARDGRAFQISSPLDVAALSETPMLVDWEHASESYMGSTRAAGWVEELRVQPEEGGKFPRRGVWGRVSWTPDGQKDVGDKAYRFLSPVLLMDGETRNVEQILSVALTNRPALTMEGISSFRERFSARLGQPQTPPEGGPMIKRETFNALLTVLALSESATEEQVLEKVRETCSAARAKGADAVVVQTLERERDSYKERVTQLEAEVAESKAAAFKAEVKAVLDKASTDGKIPPGAREGFESLCATPELFAKFKSDVLPKLVRIGDPAPSSDPKRREGASEERGDSDAKIREELKARGHTDKEIDEALKRRNSYRARPRDAREED